MSDDVRQPRQREARLHPKLQPRPARRSKQCAPRVKDAESLQQAEQKFRAIFDNTSDGIFLLDLEARKFTMGNPSCLQMLGYTPGEFVHLNIADLHHPADLPFIYAQIEEFLKGGQPIRHDIRFRRKDGSILFVDLSPSLVVLDGRRYLLVTLKDITERKRMEEELQRHTEHLEELVAARTGELQESEARYRSLYHTIADGVFVMGADGRIADANDSACVRLGYTRAELIGLPVAAISGQPDFDMGAILDRLRAAGRLSYETTHRCKDGTLIPVELSVTPIEYRGQPAVLGVARDITERRRVQESLQFTQFAVDHTADAAFWMTEEGRFFYVNEAACQALGYSRAELLQMAVYDIDPAFTEDQWRASWRRLKAEKNIVLETVHRARDGRIYPVEIRANYLEFGGREYDCAFARDITERKGAQDALRASEEKFRAMADQAPIMIGVTNEKGAITFLNRAWLDFRGTTLEEEAGWSWAEAVHPEDRDRVVSTMQSAMERRERYSLEYRIRDRLGNYRWVLDTATPLLGPGGEPRGYIGTALDLTERKWAEEAVAESRKRYRGLVEKINDWVWEIDANGVYTYVSPRARELLGCAPEEIVGRTPFDLMPPAEAARVWNAFEPIWLERKPLEQLENTLVRKDGRLVTVETSGMPIFAEDGTFLGYTGIDRDVTERKRAEEALREKEYLLSESQRIGHIGSWSVDLVTSAATWTRETYRLFGVASDTFVPTADALIGLLHPDDRDGMRAWIRAALAGVPPEALEFRVPLPDGSVRVLIGRGELIYNSDHRPIRLVGTAQDVTERKQVEEALRQLSRRNEEALRVARMGHWEFDIATGMFTFNDQYYTLHGTTAQAAGGYRMTAEEFARRYVHPDDAHLVQETIQGAAQAKDPNFELQTEARILRADGEARWVTVWFRTEHGAQHGTTKLYGVNQDITERRQAQEALRRLNEQLEQQVAQRTEELRHTVDRLRQLTLEVSQAEDRERQRIADILHDDVQQTLAAAKFHLNLLSTGPRSVEDSREIVEQVRHMLKDAIEKSRRLSHELSPALYQVGLPEILGWLARHMQEKHGLTVRVQVRGSVDSPSEPLKAFLYKVARELLFNVVKHAEVGEAAIRVRRLGPWLYLSVRDRGRGFDPQQLEGTAGFGLLSIRERVQLLGGRMRIHSAPGRGSRFLIAVPQDAAAPAARPCACPEGQAEPQTQ